MAGQQQLDKYSKETLYQKAINTLLNQADLKYVNEHFKIGEKRSILKFKHAQLFEETLCTEDCTLSNWIDKKIKGKLQKTKIKKKNDFIEVIEDNNIYVTNNYYYNLDKTWDSVEW